MDPETPETPPETPAKPAVKMVEHDRFKAVVKDRDEWKARYESEVQPLTEKAAKVDTLLETIEKLKTEHKSAAARWDEERGLLSAGVTDPEDVELVRFHYGRVQGEAKPKTIAEYVTSLKAEGAAVPRGLTHIFGKPEPKPEEPAAKPPPTAPRAHGDGKPPPASPVVNADAIRKATETWQRNPTAENKAALDSILAAHRQSLASRT